MITLKINGKEITVADGTLMLDAAKEAGYDVPTFCYHKDLAGVGTCRMCLVEIEGQRKMQPACITPVMADMNVLTETDTVRQARSSMLEFLLSNHSLDCPVCDKGGECKLQNMVRQYGPKKGFHLEKKVRFHAEDYVLSEVIVKNSNRCVQCTRCVRVCQEIVGRGVLGSVGRGSHQEETAFMRRDLDCDHCGMCIEVCPVGCFMRRPYRYKARPWDLTGTTSVCPYCATGCTITIEERDGEVVRSKADDGHGINGRMLCSRGRFGTDFVNSAARLTTPLVRKDGELKEATWEEAIEAVKTGLAKVKGDEIGAVASGRLTNEELYAFQKFVRGPLGSSNIDCESRWSADSAGAFIGATAIDSGGLSIADCVGSDAVLILGGQLSEENPVTDYLVRRAEATRSMSVVIASARAMKLDSSAAATLRHNAGAAGAAAAALASALGDGAGLKELASAAGLSEDDVKGAAAPLKAAESVGVMVGTDILRYGGSEELKALVETLRSLGKEVRVLPILDRANQRGAWDMGVHPSFGPGYEAAKEGLDTAAMLEAAGGKIKAMIVIAEDVAGLYPDKPFAKKALEKLDFLVVEDIFLTETAALADVVLPGAAFSEKDGTFTNQEGRVQAVRALVKPPGGAKCDLEIISLIAGAFSGGDLPSNAADAFSEIKKNVASYSGIVVSDGPESVGAASLTGQAKGVAARGFKGTTPPSSKADTDKPFELITGNHLLHSGTFSQRAAVLTNLIEGAVVEISEEDAKGLGLSDGDKVKVKGAHYEAVLTLKTARSTKRGVAFIAENYEEVPVTMFFRRGEALQRISIASA